MAFAIARGGLSALSAGEGLLSRGSEVLRFAAAVMQRLGRGGKRCRLVGWFVPAGLRLVDQV